MNQITVRKELLLNLGNFSNEKIVVEITTTDTTFENSWKELNKQLEQQELYERGLRTPKINLPKDVDEKELTRPF